jgi:DNA-binding LacI/PurR family transcriptional regulator
MAARVTIKQIAVLARVSTATVSHVLNATAYVSPKLRERVKRVVRELNYQPDYMARGLRTRKSRTVGMIIPNITNPFFPAQVRGVEDVLHREGYNLIVGNSDYDLQREEAYFRTFGARRVDGLVLVITPTRPPHYLQNHNFEEMPVVYIDRFYRGAGGDAVLADNIAGSQQAVSHLLELGHQRIGVITGPLHMLMARRRLLGYQRAFRAKGLAVEQELVREGAFDTQSGYEQAMVLLRLTPRPTAIFACNGLMTVGCLRAIAEVNLRCPEDLALVSFDDLEWFAHMRPGISAVRNPAYELGATAAELLVRRMSGSFSGPPQRRILETQLVLRESSALKLETSLRLDDPPTSG